ncbi:GNAT family N-acetyltransferase [Haloferula sp. A504]|uniref:GNAT family N-acetyltransferase n=1 Tax=Haloferula sp. A504 TaxID=3373601 RepID=UPI0031C02926|nr:GNAT family N-acetyltransferase [Verrucomicrobiaceae bacterium E54]
MSSIEVRSLSPAEFPTATGLLAHLNPDCTTAVLLERFRRIIEEHPHYLPIGAFRRGTMVGFAGAWVATKIWCGRYLEIDNLVVHPEHRSSGVGSALIAHLEQLGRERDCNLITLDAYTHNHASHRLYHRLGFEIWGFHFVRPLGSLDR